MKIEESLQLGQTLIHNRVVFQPMEGCDCLEDGSPSDLTRAKYVSFAKSGAGIIWFEANAVCKEGRTNAGQMSLTKENLPVFQTFLKELRQIAREESGFEPLMILQLTHSGRQSIKPMIAYRNPVYEEKRPVTDEAIVSDEYLDSLPEKYADSARLAALAGFDGVDVKSCHGYLLQEMLSAYTRKGRYGGSFENRTRLFIECINAVKKAVPKDFLVVSRLGVTDMVPYPWGFGTDERNNLDLTEAKLLVQKIHELGIDLINITLGNPYYNPHVNRPYRVGAYKPDESAEVGLKRFWEIEKELKTTFPDIVFVGSGLSYYRGEIFQKAEEMLREGVCDLVGFGRIILAYPDFYKRYLSGTFDAKKCCITCSKCTELMRNHCVAGCAVFHEYYKKLYEEKVKHG